MCIDNNIEISEVQFDCDWTKTTQSDFYEFLKQIKYYLKEYFDKPILISSTIRLHQLAQTPPPADYGVLMCYNTGNFKDFETYNSILDTEDVKPYLKYLMNYNLALRLALPVYSWNLVYDEDKAFNRIEKNFNVYQDAIEKYNNRNNIYTYKIGSNVEHVREENVSTSTILATKKLIEKEYGKISTVLYHLDSVELIKYTDNEIKSFYN